MKDLPKTEEISRLICLLIVRIKILNWDISCLNRSRAMANFITKCICANDLKQVALLKVCVWSVCVCVCVSVRMWETQA